MTDRTVWVEAAIEYMSEAGPKTALELFEDVPGAESADIARKRMYRCVRQGTVTMHKDGVKTYFAPAETNTYRASVRWAAANQMPRVASVFHLAQGVYA